LQTPFFLEKGGKLADNEPQSYFQRPAGLYQEYTLVKLFSSQPEEQQAREQKEWIDFAYENNMDVWGVHPSEGVELFVNQSELQRFQETFPGVQVEVLSDRVQSEIDEETERLQGVIREEWEVYRLSGESEMLSRRYVSVGCIPLRRNEKN
jgi:hypothetical protein